MKKLYVMTWLLAASLLTVEAKKELVLPVQAQNMFVNPILGGDYPDPTILRDGEDYYMTHSSFDYQPGLTVFHSRDLVHWEPISFALKEYLGSVWAPDIKKYQGKYYIYFTVAKAQKTNYVVVADSPYGPWSDPIDLKVNHIDPCHVVGEDGRRYLILSGGDRVLLADDGLSVIPGSMKHIYDGWQFPSDWATEGLCLEGPKLYHIGKYFYYISAEGGTAGPPTSHMVTVARSEHIDGPWENMPSNPLVHTYYNTDRWWSRGHGSLIDTPDGRWYIVYHAYENGFLNLGRQTLMEPVHFTDDDWIVADGGDASMPMLQPLKQWNPTDRLAHLDEFRVGLDWKFYKAFDPARVKVADGALTLQAKGNSLSGSSPLMFIAGAHSYEFEAEIDIEGDVKAGLTLIYDSVFNVGTGFDQKNRYRYRRNEAGRRGASMGKHLWLRLRNDNHVVTGYWSEDGKHWTLDDWGMEVSGFSHHTLHQFQSLLPGVFVQGNGQATFRNFKYRELEIKQPLTKTILNGVPWYDQNGKPVSAHGANIIKDGDRYYMFGEYKTDSANVFTGFSCYSSDDLCNWRFECIAFTQQTDGRMGPGRVGERPKVLKCPATGEYVMLMHSDNLRYMDPCVCYATSKTVNGEYTFQGPLLYKGQPIKKWDIGSFMDDDGHGYLLVHHGYIYRLAPDFHSADSCLISGLEGTGESPAMFKKDGTYYWLSSHTTSWERNDNMYFTAKSLAGPWKYGGAFAPKGSLTWNSQCSFVLTLPDGTPMYMGDRWSFPRQQSAATYVWLPMQANDDNLMIPDYWETWDPTTAKPQNLVTQHLADGWTGQKPGDNYTLKINGAQQIAIYGTSDSQSGYAEIFIKDNNDREVFATSIDFYSKIPATGLRWVSPKLPKGNYTLGVRVSEMKPNWTDKTKTQYGSTGYQIKITEIVYI